MPSNENTQENKVGNILVICFFDKENILISRMHTTKRKKGKRVHDTVINHPQEHTNHHQKTTPKNTKSVL
jgi:hypothetical protein